MCICAKCSCIASVCFLLHKTAFHVQHRFFNIYYTYFQHMHNVTFKTMIKKHPVLKIDVVEKINTFYDFVNGLWFFEQYKEIDERHIVYWVHRNLPTELKWWFTAKQLAEYWSLHENTVGNRRVYDSVIEVWKMVAVKMLRSDSTKDVLDQLVMVATWRTAWNPVPAQKLYLQFVEQRTEKLALEHEGDIEVRFWLPASQFVQPLKEEKPKKESKRVWSAGKKAKKTTKKRALKSKK